ncbi:UNVERIFIED_CONTAM: hypothetical protein QE602_10840, partial [Streptococcus suis]
MPGIFAFLFLGPAKTGCFDAIGEESFISTAIFALPPTCFALETGTEQEGAGQTGDPRLCVESSSSIAARRHLFLSVRTGPRSTSYHLSSTTGALALEPSLAAAATFGFPF